ncbi:MAG: hypothetical protein QM778_36095 [Myxococcales bacterium]
MMEFACAAHRAGVARGELRQTDVRVLEDGAILALASALGPPRLWGYGLDAAFQGFEEGLARPHDGRVVTRLHQGLDAAGTRLKVRVEALVERRRCDVGLVAVAVEAGYVHVLSVGPVRAYLRRRDQVKRLTPREDRAEGLLKARPSFCSERAEPGDLVVAGSLPAFCDESLQSVGAALASDPGLPTRQITELLNKSAAAGRVGVSSIALRIP